jgi:hypothetical protein
MFKDSPNPRLTVFRREPLLRAISAVGVSPVGLGIGFFFSTSLTLSVWAALAEPSKVKPDYVSYFANISWSISMIFLFPFMVSLTLKYYQEIPNLFEFLLRKTDQGESDTDNTDRDKFYSWLDHRFNSYWVSGSALALSISLSVIYFYQIFQNQEFGDWITSGELLGFLFPHGRGFTAVGLYAALILIVILYWVANLIWRGIVLAWGLHELFNIRNYPVNIRPFHPDNCCGLRKIGDVAMLLNLTLFILGIYVSLKVIDKIVIQNSSLSLDIGNPIMLAAYLLIAPLLFFLPLAAPHRQMNEAKETFLEPVNRTCERLFGELADVTLDDKGSAALQAFSALDATIVRLHKEIPVWPFDFRSVRAFAATIVIPILPIVLPFVIKLIFVLK